MLGLRPRVFAALLLSSAVTLAVAALTLLSPLEQRLRTDAETAVFTAISASRSELAEVDLSPKTGRPDEAQLKALVNLMRRRSGAQVTILDRSLETLYSSANENFDVPDYYAPARQALRTGRGVHTLVDGELVAAEPMRIGESGAVYAVIFVRRLQYVSSAVHVVRKAFLEAAAVGLGIALVLGLALTTTLLRRLEHLRELARELEHRGLDAPVPHDERRDEIGDLTRAFASLQRRLRRQEEARATFLATASHELRTPLASLDGTLELLEDDLDASRLDLADARERALGAREQSRRLSSLATDLLDLTRLDAEVSLRSEPVELGELCRAVAAEFERRGEQLKVAVVAHQPRRSCWARCDPGAVARIVRILLDNAVGVAPAGSSVDARAGAGGSWAFVTVEDDGPGVTDAERERIFERFERGSASSGRSGFGLGLAIGRELATRMGGELALDGAAETGGGARFVLRLPVAHLDQDGAR